MSTTGILELERLCPKGLYPTKTLDFLDQIYSLFLFFRVFFILSMSKLMCYKPVLIMVTTFAVLRHESQGNQ